MTLRELSNALLHRIVLAGLYGRLTLQTRLGLAEMYQPIPYGSWRPASSRRFRACADRFEAFSARLPQAPLSTLDVGCNAGYFTFEMAKRGGFCIGIDPSRNDLMIARAVAAIYEIPNTVFAELELHDGNVDAIPRVDVVLCLSVFHHWARKLGEERAVGLVRRLAASAQRFLVFETGQPEESDMAWASALEFMLPDSHRWTQTMLTDIGFCHVQLIGEFATSVSPVPRRLYLATR